MLHHWADYYRENLNVHVEVDRSQAEEVVSALPAPGVGEERAMRVRLLTSTVAAFVGNRRNSRWPTTREGLLSPAFLNFAVKNLPQGQGAVVKDLRRQLIEAAKAHNIAVPQPKAYQGRA